MVTVPAPHSDDADAPHPLIGTTLRGTYRILRTLDQGGMGIVFEAEHVRLRRRVAVKVLAQHLTKDALALARFNREAEIISQLQHPHVVQVTDFDTTEAGEPYLVMELLSGESLAARLGRERCLPIADAVRIAYQVSSGLSAAHAASIVHRDLKPANILVQRKSDGSLRFRLTDFGIGGLANLQSEPTAPHGISGKLSYAAPEYLSTKQFDAQSDLFSLGVVAWESLAQARLFQGATPVETMLKVLHARAPALDSIRPELAPLAPAVARALSRNAIDRQPSVQAFAEAIEAAARSSDGVASHAEVAELVERLAGAELATRRRELSNLQAGEVATPASCMPLRSARDEVATETLLPLPAAWQTSAPSAGRRSLGVYGVLAPLTCALALVAVFFGGQKHSTTANRAPIQQSPMKAARAVPLVQPAATSTAQPSAAPSASSQPLPRAKRVGSTKSTPVLSAAPGGASASPAQPAAQARADALLFPEQAPPNPYAVEANH